MTIITLLHLFFGHCVNLSMTVLDLGINTSVQNNHLQFHTMTSKKNGAQLLLSNLLLSLSWTPILFWQRASEARWWPRHVASLHLPWRSRLWRLKKYIVSSWNLKEDLSQRQNQIPNWHSVFRWPQHLLTLIQTVNFEKKIKWIIPQGFSAYHHFSVRVLQKYEYS